MSFKTIHNVRRIPYRFVYWAILENVDPAARAIQGITLFSIVLLGKPILEVKQGKAINAKLLQKKIKFNIWKLIMSI